MKIDTWGYFKQVCAEETLFRVILLGVLALLFRWIGVSPDYAIFVSALIFGLVHLVGFTWLMAFASFIVGCFIGAVYFYCSLWAVGYVVAVAFHFAIGAMGWRTGFTKYCMREGVWRNYLRR